MIATGILPMDLGNGLSGDFMGKEGGKKTKKGKSTTSKDDHSSLHSNGKNSVKEK